ncbi:MAG: Na+/H+ antiporter NhaC family protein [Microcoleaceae cyanobacterium]
MNHHTDYTMNFDLIVTLILAFIMLVFSVLNGIFILWPLIVVMLLLIIIFSRRGIPFQVLIQMAVRGAQQSFSVLKILLLIGAVTAIWMAAGTVPAMVYYGLQIINPHYFILLTFLLTSFVSILLGTSFGTVSTIGLALMIMASQTTINPHIIAGAIIAGAYVGDTTNVTLLLTQGYANRDRCSPMSSSANLIATITKTHLYTNIRNMLKTGLLTLLISSVIYGILSILNPVEITDYTILNEIQNQFNIQPFLLLPAVAILFCAICKIDVKLSLLISFGIASVIALSYQQFTLLNLAQFIILGFQLSSSNPLSSILIGGGIFSMIKVSAIVLTSTAIAEILAENNTFNALNHKLQNIQTQRGLFISTTLIGTLTAMFGCTQTIAILLTQKLVQPQYKLTFPNHTQLAIDLENTVVVISPLIPWNIAGLVPATILMTDFGFIPYAFYLYLLPLINLIHLQKLDYK